MPMNLTPGHRWSIFQTYGRMPNISSEGSWAAVIVDNATGKAVVESELSASREAAIADAERKYKARNGR